MLAATMVACLAAMIFNFENGHVMGARRKSALFAIGGACGYLANETVRVKVNSMWSQQHPNEPLGFYETLPFCEPTECMDPHENLAETLTGQRYQNSPFQDVSPTNASKLLPGVAMLQPVHDRLICRKEYTQDELDQFKKRVSQHYRVRLVVDDLPNVELEFLRNQHNSVELEHVTLGYQLGVDDQVFTHLDIVIQYNECGSNDDADADEGEKMYNIVGFITTPHNPVHVGYKAWNWTYSLSWEESDIPYASRFDPLLKPNHEVATVQIAYFIVALVILFVSSGTVYQLVHVSARRVLSGGGGGAASHYKPAASGTRHSVDIENNRHVYDVQRHAPMKVTGGVGGTEGGWKHIGEFVFRAPPSSIGAILAVLVATGVHLLSVLVVICIAGFASIAFVRHRLAIFNIAILCYVILSSLAGYVCARWTRTIVKKVKHQQLAMVFGMVFYPCVVLLTLFCINQVLSARKSTAVIDVYTSVVTIGSILIVSTMCYVAGYMFGSNHGPHVFPLEAAEESRKPRDIPRSAFDGRSSVYYGIQLFIGFISYAVSAVALMFIYDSLWGGRIYSMYTILWMCVIAWLFTTGALDMVFIHLQLNAENYNWWLPSFMAPAFVGVFILIHSVVYAMFFSPVESFASLFIYFGYSFLLAFSLSIISGSVGFLMCKYLVVSAYHSVKSS